MAACAFASLRTISAASVRLSPRFAHRSHLASAKCSYPASPSHDADQQNSAPDPTHRPSQKPSNPPHREWTSLHPKSTGKKAPPSHPLPHQTPYKTLPPVPSSPAKQNPISPAPPPHVASPSSAATPPHTPTPASHCHTA